MTTSETSPHATPDAAVTDSGNASANTGGVANTGVMGDVEVEHHEHHHYPRAVPAADHATTDLVAALRTNTTTLAGIAGGLLWHPDGHPLLYEAGVSLLRAGLHTPAVTYWHHMTEQAGRLLGDEHPDTVAAAGALRAWRAEA